MKKIKTLKECRDNDKKFKGIYVISYEKLCKNKDNIIDLLTSLSLSGKLFTPQKWEIRKIYILSDKSIMKLKSNKSNKKVIDFIQHDLNQPSLCDIKPHSKEKNVITLKKIFKRLSVKQVSLIHEYLKSYLEKEVKYKNDKPGIMNLYKRLILKVVGYAALIMQKKNVCNERCTRWIAISACLISLIAIVVDAVIKR